MITKKLKPIDLVAAWSTVDVISILQQMIQRPTSEEARVASIHALARLHTAHNMPEHLVERFQKDTSDDAARQKALTDLKLGR